MKKFKELHNTSKESPNLYKEFGKSPHIFPTWKFILIVTGLWIIPMALWLIFDNPLFVIGWFLLFILVAAIAFFIDLFREI